MAEAVYYDIWTSRDDVSAQYGADTPLESEIVYAGYSYEDYNGSAIVVFVRDGKWYENHDGHCSCYGLEDWSPEETTPEALLMRKDYWVGCTDAVKARLKHMELAPLVQSGRDKLGE